MHCGWCDDCQIFDQDSAYIIRKNLRQYYGHQWKRKDLEIRKNDIVKGGLYDRETWYGFRIRSHW